MKYFALLVAAGKGSRVNKDNKINILKQYYKINNKSILQIALENFIKINKFEKILVVINKDNENEFKEATFEIKDKIDFCYGGNSRKESVNNGLKYLEKYANLNDIILIHDAVRPGCSTDLINRILDKAKYSDCVIPFLESEDSLKNIENEKLSSLNRENIIRVQTPQAFNFGKILKYHDKIPDNKNITDDCGIFEYFNEDICLVKGCKNNYKITFLEDLKQFELSQQQNIMDIRIGSGFDVHKFDNKDLDKNYVTLGGIKIKHNFKLIGHSDADVVLHSLTDAILGALAMGDIGEHFPPSNNEYKDMNSEIFVKKALKLCQQKNYKINNVDITIICENPKITPHKLEIRENIAKILNLSLDKISVKATTTEKLGFTGREEGIAAQASVIINNLSL